MQRASNRRTVGFDFPARAAQLRHGCDARKAGVSAARPQVKPCGVRRLSAPVTECAVCDVDCHTRRSPKRSVMMAK